ncbi:hypothetical protein [Symmachiella dynata]|uniref:hypothetical protein n=1 Tax=Symmachiella dynata TaxID=2527995 RepID=UPI0030EF8CDA
MDPFAIIRDKLTQRNVDFVDEQDSISVPSQTLDGFPVYFCLSDPMYVVSLGGWHGHFKDADAALKIFFLGLTSHLRLCVTSRGSWEYRWKVEICDENQWQEMGTDIVPFFPFWKAKRVFYQQNNLLPMPEGMTASILTEGWFDS